MKLSWNNIVNIGVDETLDPSDVRYVNLINIIAIYVFFFELGNVSFFFRYLPQIEFLKIFGTFVALLNFGVVLLNYFKFYLAARLFFGLLALLAITVNSLFLGRETLMHIYLLECIVVAFFIYPPSQKMYRKAIIALFTTSFLGLEIWFIRHTAIIQDAPKLFTYTTISGLVLSIIAISFYTYTMINRAEAELKEEQKKSEDLLLNILPKSIAKRLKDSSDRIADHFEEASILFSDIVNFTDMVKTMSADKIVSMLDEIFTEFDLIADRHGLEKIKTIGDSYMVVGGVPEPRADHCEAIADMALTMQKVMHDKYFPKYKGIKLRIGIHTGSVVAGVIGKKNLSYDFWGESVNMASRMESHCIEDKIQVTQEVYEKLKDHYQFEYRGHIEIKGKDKVATYFLISRKI
jgi:class 3 adenylate cyclase